MRVTVLGCGASAGVPLLGCACPVCTSPNPKNRRMRVSITVESKGSRVLVDTGPDLRVQLLQNDIRRLDGVIFTHCHADHVHGIDDIRAVNHQMGGALDAWADAETFKDLKTRFGYAFDNGGPIEGLWLRPSLNSRPIEGPFRVGAMDITPFPQSHGAYRDPALGLRFGNFAYSTDVKDIPDSGFAALEGVKVWIVDCLSPKENPAHSHLAQTLEWIARVKPARAILTHMNHLMDYDRLRATLPPGVEPAYDGMVVEVPD
jgi:phosphoribosyl 1,2-cyclic phosphate phosphodiesterase